MKRMLLVSLLPLWMSLSLSTARAQNVLANVRHLAGSSDNTGQVASQPGTEVLHSLPGVGVDFAPAGSFEHVGQFYVAQDGLWQAGAVGESGQPGTDYFGYAPKPVGAYVPYQGAGIKGASSANGGTGAGQPIFGHLHLNSTERFPVEGGMHITHSLIFDASGPGRGNVILTPNAVDSRSAGQGVRFESSAQIRGAGDGNCIDGFASVFDAQQPFTLPLGESNSLGESLQALTVNNAPGAWVSARYRAVNPRSAMTLGPGLQWVSSVGHWLIDAPTGAQIVVSLPTLAELPGAAADLRLVGWNGQAWIDLSGHPTPGASLSRHGLLGGHMLTGVTELGIGSVSQVVSEGESAELRLWPNPTRGKLSLSLSNNEPIAEASILNLQGCRIKQLSIHQASLDASQLPAGTYLLEVKTAQNQRFRRRFIKQ